MSAGCYEIIGVGANRVSVPHRRFAVDFTAGSGDNRGYGAVVDAVTGRSHAVLG
jgi:hypothetical protein